jgi:hypothetical protein
MISVIKHVADQQPQRRPAPPNGRIDWRRTSRWSHMRFPEANTIGTADAGSYNALHAFICYKHRAVRAKGVLAHVSVALSQAHRRLFEQAESTNLDWAEQLAREIKRSDVAVAVLSNQ